MADKPPSKVPLSGTVLLPFVLIAVAIIVITAGNIFYTFKQGNDNEVGRLQAIADLKARQIADWLRERDGDAHFVQSSRYFAETYRHWRDTGDASIGEALKKRLNEYREDRLFQGVMLFGEQSEVLWNSEGPQVVLDPDLKAAISLAATEGRSLRIGPYPDAAGRPRLDLVAPLLLAGTRPLPSVVLSVDPGVYLFPTLQTWPVPSASGETLLIRRDGEEVLFLNGLSHTRDTAAIQRMPLTKEGIAARVLRGEVKPGSPVKGLDYRGVPVIGVARAIPGTDWFLVAKVDRAEMRADAIQDSLWISLTGLLALVMAASGFFLFHQRQELAFSLRERETQAEKLRALQLLDAIAEGSGDAIFAKDMDGRYLFFNREAARVIGKSPAEVPGKDDMAIFPPEQAALIIANDRKVMEQNRIVTFQEEVTTVDGDITFLSVKGPLHDPAGNVMGMFGIARDITERRRAEQTLRESEEKFRLAFRTSPDSINLNRLSDGMYIDINEGFTKMTGYTREDVIGKTSLGLNIWQEPEDRERLVAALESTGFMENLEAKFRAKDGRTIIGLMSARLLRINEEEVLLNITRDITDRKGAEEERKKLELQLFHALKLESVGRLAGGVAHDFNNMLNVIIGRTEMALMPDVSSDALRRHLHGILKAAKRSADLTGQLLAFARKQTADPKILDLNHTIAGLLVMLQRLIGEDISLAWMPGRDLWKVCVDPSQIDQILANLTINARDALPGAGAISLSTENVVLDDSFDAGQEGFAAGKYVLLTMSDTGSGMDKEVLEHIFEPFFTTKAFGQGTGLGLATVYGIVRQNNGFLKVSSTQGKGTTFQIYFPGLEDTAAGVPSVEQVEEMQGGSETILLVEDDEAVLDSSKVMLELLGYTVLAANTPEQAIRFAEAHPGDLHLLITDVVMPQMNGRELVEKLRTIRPGLKCLYMSGYTADVIAHRGILDEGVNFIQKPFSSNDFAARVRKVLGLQEYGRG